MQPIPKIEVTLAPAAGPQDTGLGNGSGSKVDIFRIAINDAKAPFQVRVAAARHVLDLDSDAAWAEVERLIEGGGEPSLVVVTALGRRVEIPAQVRAALSHRATGVPEALRLALESQGGVEHAVPRDGGADESSNGIALANMRLEREQLLAQSATDRAILGRLVDEVMARTSPPEQVPLALAWLLTDSPALLGAALLQLERVAREGTRLGDDALDAIAARAWATDAANRATVVRLLMDSARESDQALLLAMFQAESSPAVMLELLRIKGLEGQPGVGARAIHWLAARETRDVSAALLLHILESELAPAMEWRESREFSEAASRAAATAWDDAPTASLAALTAGLAMHHGGESSAGIDAAVDRLVPALQSADAKIRRAAATALLALDRESLIPQALRSETEVRRAMLDRAVATAATAADIESIRNQFSPAAGAEPTEAAVYRAALVAALEALSAVELLKADQALGSVELSAEDRARFANRALAGLGADAVHREVKAALAVRAAEHLISAGQFQEAADALSGDVGLADPSVVDALRIAAALGLGGGAALPARPQDESEEAAAAALARGAEVLQRLNPAAAAGMVDPRP
ncbi:MAG: hypothetical protein O2819_09045 [Planctomycetota bacterium]|nr:hypothetical protein [Planctomycetota bacterium]